MASKPANPKMWAMIVAQARAKYSNYPNPGASHWVHKTYVEHGGRFIETTEADRKMGIAKKKHEKEKLEKSTKTDKDQPKKKASSKKDKGKK
jgi:hypothetical protein